MNSFIDFINNLLPFLYIITFTVYSYDFMSERSFGKANRGLANYKRLFLFSTLLIHLIYLLTRTIAFNHPPITNVFEIFTVMAFSVSFSYFILELVTDIRGTGPFIIIYSIIFQVISSIFIKDLIEVKEVLRNNLLGSHVFTALLGLSGFTISAVYGFLYLTLYKDIKLNKFGLIFNRLPSLEVLEKLSYLSAVIGFILLTIAMTIGVIWLPKAFPDFSYSDPKLISSFLVWLLYGIGILSKSLGKWRGKKVVVLSIIGFVMAIMSTMISNFLAKSFHSFY
ncbi:MAG: cytochrome C biogenesis protein [Ignavibacteria bacterium RBG_16_34_14]|nr:MAG: cytochrome C biogenesis protein [Ignavibacteria bacterium RBG_16_34_14]